MSALLDEILSLYARRGSAAYFGEPVSMTEHGLQAAYFARRAGAPESLVVAALLHDVGHLVVPAPDRIEDWVEDANHEDTGSRWLAERFPRAVSEPVELHVAAKRYLCAVDPSYMKRLSAASVHTLRLQGGPMSASEVAAFESRPHQREAIALRDYDDQGKVAGLATEPMDFYRDMIERVAAQRG